MEPVMPCSIFYKESLAIRNAAKTIKFATITHTYLQVFGLPLNMSQSAQLIPNIILKYALPEYTARN